MLFVSPRGVNHGFWFHLGCSGGNATISSRQGIFFRVAGRKYE